MASPTSHSWRELLGQLTERPAERQRAAEALGVTPYTITRWVNGESEPRFHNLKRLPEIFPAYQQRLSELVQAELTPTLPSIAALAPVPARTPVPAEFLVRLLSAYAHISGPFRAWSMRTLVLQEAVTHLDADRVGMQISLVQCVPPQAGEAVRSLCVRLSIGTPPWESGVRDRLLFLGAESLCGWMLGRGQPAVVEDLHDWAGNWPVPETPGREQAAASWPFLREGKLAGCLLVVSTQHTFLTVSRLESLEVYANALALSFRDEDFVPLHQILLHELPHSLEAEEKRWLTRMQGQIRRVRREQEYCLSEFAAERLVFHQLEDDALGLTHPEA